MTRNKADHWQEVHDFWFTELTPEDWFKKDDSFDQQLQDRFGDLVGDALGGRLDRWAEADQSCLSLILLLDQMTRNIFRNQPRAFAGDEFALSLSLKGQAAGWIAAAKTLPERQFWLMPMMHSEDLAVQDSSLPLFEKLTNEDIYGYAVRHRDIIARFGRFPHRNAILGRPSSAEEEAFLQEPNSSF
jgi:uncharacterized protein (DUF924 family)